MQEKIQLTEEQITELYKDNLLLIHEHKEALIPDENNTIIDYKGGFQKKILWLHAEKEHSYILEDDFEMLTRILDACRLNWNDIALVNMTHQPLEADMVIQKTAPEYVIYSLGEPQDYQVVRRTGTAMIYTHRLQDIKNDKSLKQRLWQALKLLFELS